MKRLVLVLAFLIIPALVHAQAVTSYTYRIYNQGAAAPVQAPTVLQVANVVCNQPAVANPGQTSNPSKVVFDDTTNAGKTCVWTDPGNGVLFSLPFGAQVYESTLTASAGTLTSPESARSNLFTRPGLPPPAPTGVKVVP